MPTLRAYALTFPGASGPPLAACPVRRLDSHSLDTPKHPCSFMHLSNTKYWHISGYLILFSSQAVGGKCIVGYEHSGIHHCSQKLQCYLLFLEAKTHRQHSEKPPARHDYSPAPPFPLSLSVLLLLKFSSGVRQRYDELVY